MKYQEIVLFIREQTDQGRIQPGERLPSIREICSMYHCNKATAIRAYQELEEKHLIYAVPKSGYYVMDQGASPTLTEQALIDFSSACPSSDVLPYLDFQHCLNQAIARYRENLFTYMDPRGLPSLRQTLAEQLRDYQVFAQPDLIHVTSGSQQALEILAKMPFPNGKTHILIEQPTYFGMLKAAQLNQVTLHGIERSEQGLDFEELERIFRGGNIKFFYTIPRFHNPLGVSYPLEQKKRILKLAAKYDVYLLEDDYLADLENNSRTDPLFAMDSTSRVIYIRSYSKTLMPGLRLGVVVLPPKLGNTFMEYKRWSDLSTSILSQGALEIYLKSGMYLNHLRHIKQLYQERMACLKDACREMLPAAVPAFIPETGFFASLTLPFRITMIEETARCKNVLIRDLQNTYLPGYGRDDLLRLSICKTNPEQIRKGMVVISQEMKRILKDYGDHQQPDYETEL